MFLWQKLVALLNYIVTQRFSNPHPSHDSNSLSVSKFPQNGVFDTVSMARYFPTFQFNLKCNWNSKFYNGIERCIVKGVVFYCFDVFTLLYKWSFFPVDKSSLLCRPNKNTPFQICIFLNLRFSEIKEFVIEFHISIQIIFNGIFNLKKHCHTLVVCEKVKFKARIVRKSENPNCIRLATKFHKRIQFGF